MVADKGFKSLKAPIGKVTCPHTPVPFSPTLEDEFMPIPRPHRGSRPGGAGLPPMTRKPRITDLGEVMQLAYVPADFDGALKFWIEVMGAGPFFALDHVQLTDLKYRGAPATSISPWCLASGATCRSS